MLPWQTFFGFYIWGAHWCHLANTTEPSVCGGDAALCQITLTTCSLSYLLYLFSYFSVLSTRIDPLRFEARGCRRRPNVGLVFLCVDFVLKF